MRMKKIILIIVLVVIGGSIWYYESQRPERKGNESGEIKIQSMDKKQKASQYDTAKELVGVQQFINSESFKLADFIGKKVILIDFWTYSCINCQRTTPYLNAWWDKYKDKGLLIVGVHTPEFEFEKKYENVKAAVEKFGIKYPVVQDNSYSTWTAYDNRYWPRKYLIDIDGFIVYDHIGEGGYKETEMKIQELLNERMAVLGEEGKIAEKITEEKANGIRAESPETYFGSARNQNFGSGTPGQEGTFKFVQPVSIKNNVLYLTGDWQLTPEYAQDLSVGAKIFFKYNAKEVYFVASSEAGIKIRVWQDGKPVMEFAGDDISKDEKSEGFIKESRLYKLIKNTVQGEHILEIIFESPGLKAFAFTFG